MNRRGFLKALFAGTAALALPVSAIQLVAPELFRLVGDGYHNDAPALQALIAGDRVIGPSGQVMQMDGNSVIRLPAGTYLIGSGETLIGRHDSSVRAKLRYEA